MSKGAPPDKSVASTAGIAHVRHLTIKPLNTGKKDNGNNKTLPDGWYFNEHNEQQFWDDIESSNSKRASQMQSELLKHTEQIADIQDTSGKIRALMSKMDDIDQDTLTELLQIYEDGQVGGIDELDKDQLLHDSKLNVTEFIKQLKDLSGSQSKLMETLRYWFSTLQQQSNINDEFFDIGDLPSVDNIYNQLSEIFEEYAQKSEQVSCIHNEMNEYWFKQIGNFKRALLQKNEEISKLNKHIDKLNDQARHQRRKIEQQQQSTLSNDLAIVKEQLEKQLRLNQEQKQQIEQLRVALHQAEIEKAALGSMNNGKMERSNTEFFEHQAEMNSIKLEYETKFSNQDQIIEQLKATIEAQRKTIEENQGKISQLAEKNKTLEEEKGDLEQQLQKTLQLLEIEKMHHTEKPCVIKQEDSDRSELYEAEMRHQEEIRELENRHRLEMNQQAEIARAKYLKEREKIINAIENGDQSALLKSISDECNKKIESIKQDHLEAQRKIADTYTSKIAYLTRQYENRIRSLNQSHQQELIATNESMNYELKKKELDLEEKYHIQMIRLSKEHQDEIDDLQKHNSKLSEKVENLESENVTLKHSLTNLQSNKSIALEDVLDFPLSQRSNASKASRLFFPDNTAAIKADVIEQYTLKLQKMREELDNQREWELHQQKMFYEKQMKKLTAEHQEEMRQKLMQLQEKLTKLSTAAAVAASLKVKSSKAHSKAEEESEEEDHLEKEIKTLKLINSKSAEVLSQVALVIDGDDGISATMNAIADTFGTMNKQLENIETNDNNPTMLVADAAMKTKELTDRIISLNNEIVQLKTKGNDQSLIVENEALRNKLDYLKTSLTDDQQAVYIKMEMLEQEFNNKLAEKDKLIQSLSMAKEFFDERPLTHIVSTICSLVPESKKKVSISDVLTTFQVKESTFTFGIASSKSLDLPPQEDFVRTSRSTLSETKDIEPSKDETINTQFIPEHSQIEDQKPSFVENPEPTHIEKSPPKQTKISEPIPKKVKVKLQIGSPLYQEMFWDDRELQKLYEKTSEVLIEKIRSQIVPLHSPEMKHEVETTIEQVFSKLPKEGDVDITPPPIRLVSVPQATIEYEQKSGTISINIPDNSFIEKSPKLSLSPPQFTNSITTTITKISSSQVIADISSTAHHELNVKKDISLEVKGSGAFISIGEETLSHNLPFFTVKRNPVSISRAALIEIPGSDSGEIPAQSVLIIKEPLPIAELNYSEVNEFNIPESSIDSDSLLKENERLQREVNRLNIVNSNAQSKIVFLKEEKLDEDDTPKMIFAPRALTEDQAKKLNEKRNKPTSIPIPQPTPVVPSTTPEPTEPEAPKAPKAPESSESEVEPEPQPLKPSTPTEVDDNRSSFKFDDSQFSGDPFLAGNYLLGLTYRKIEKHIEDTGSIYGQMNSTTSAYDAYIHAAGLTDEAHFSYLNEMKTLRVQLDDIHEGLYPILGISEILGKYITKMREAYQNVSADLASLRQRDSEEKLALQQQLVSTLSNRSTDERTPIQLRQLETLQQGQSTLELIATLGLYDDEGTESTRQQLLARYRGLIQRLSDGSDVPQSEIDNLLNETQQFIGSIKRAPEESHSPRQSDSDPTQLSHDLKRIRSQRNALQKENKALKLSVSTLTEENRKLRDRLEDTNGRMRLSASEAAAKISTLRDALQALDPSTSDGDPTQIIARLKQQVIDLHALSEASGAERDMYKQKAEDLEDQLTQSNETIERLRFDLEKAYSSPNQPFEQQNAAQQNEMFREADFATLQEEREADRRTIDEQRLELERSAAAYRELEERQRHLEHEILSARQAHQSDQDQIDDLLLKLASSSDSNKQHPHLDEATQCFINLPNTEPSLQPEEPIKPPEEPEEKPPTPTETEEKPETPKEPEEQPESSVATSTIDQKDDEASADLGSLTAAPTEGAESGDHIDLSGGPGSLEIIEDENRDTIAYIEEADGFGELSLPDSSVIIPGFSGDDRMIQVHDPLQWQLKPKPIKLPPESRTVRTTKLRPMRHVFASHAAPPETPTEDPALTIGNAGQKRMLTGANRPIRPKHTIHEATNILIHARETSLLHDLPGGSNDIGHLPTVTSSVNIPPKRTISQQQQQPQTHVMQEKEVESPVMGTPVRITLVVKEKQKEERKEPLVVRPLPVQAQAQTPSPLQGRRGGGTLEVVGGRVTRPSENPALTEALKQVSKLREVVRKLQEQNEGKDREIMSLKQRISELTLQLHRAKLDNIKHGDDVKRISIRYDNAKSRLEICFKEISSRDDEIARLRRELVEARSRQIPVDRAMNTIRNAAAEKRRLLAEEEKRRAVAAVTKNAMKNAGNDQMRSHLENILEHEKLSLARIEEKRKMWTEIQRKQTMAVLGASSLLADSQYQVVRAVLPNYSPFAASKIDTLKQIMERNNAERYTVGRGHWNDPELPGVLSYSVKIQLMDKANLSADERKMVIEMKESPEIEEKLRNIWLQETKNNQLNSQTIVT